MAPLIAVFGATGNQGGSVALSLLQNPSFKVRALTRNLNSLASQSLASSGADVVLADGFNSSEMLAAFHGAWGAFVKLNSNDKVFSSPDGPTEFDLGKIIVDAAAQAGVKHLVFSSAAPCSQMTDGKVRMKAMDIHPPAGKFQTFTPIIAAWLLENFLNQEVAPITGGFPLFFDEEGYLTFRMPRWGGDNQVPFLSVVEDFGDIVHGIFLDPEKWNGRVVQGVSCIRSFQKLVTDFEKVTGKKSRFQPILPSWEAFETYSIPELEDVKHMFGFTQITGGRFFGPLDLEPGDTKNAAELKKATAVAVGRPKEGSLVTVEEWFRLRFAS